MIACYVSGHGFGHATRVIEVLNALGDRAPDVPVVLRTSAPRWVFDAGLTRPVQWAPRECDTGIVQVDSLSLDEAETVRRAEAFHATLDPDAEAEAAWLRAAGVRLVMGDIPPLAFAAARAANLPAVALGNFTWDWIYEGYRAWMADGARLPSRLAEAYASADLALRLPMHGGFSMFRAIVDLPFVARQSRRDPAATRRDLGLPPDGPIALLSFGGYGLRQIDLHRAAALCDWTIVVTADVTANRRADRAAAAGPLALPDRVVLIEEYALRAAGYRYEDLVAAVDVVMTKPGYGIVAECVAHGTALVYTPRGHFVESDVIVREMPRWLRCGYLSNDDLRAGRWQEALDAVRAQANPPERIGVDGAGRAAGLLLDRLP